MIVEDDQIIRMLLKNIIKRIKTGVSIIECENGREALEKMDDTVDLIFSDNNMPVMSGFELLNQLKQNKRFANIPIVMVTVEAKKNYIEKGLSSGFSDWIVKPFQTREIGRCLDQFL
jgi:CheY-like chemotaxis protein